MVKKKKKNRVGKTELQKQIFIYDTEHETNNWLELIKYR